MTAAIFLYAAFGGATCLALRDDIEREAYAHDTGTLWVVALVFLLWPLLAIAFAWGLLAGDR